jgi:hypothetical protein
MILNIGGHGIGDCILSLQISFFLSKFKIRHKNLISARSEVFDVLKFLFSSDFELEKIDEKFGENNAIISDPNLQEELKTKFNSSDLTFNVPDLLFRNPLAFNLLKYNLSPQIIKQHRLLVATNSLESKENIIYCGLSTSTENYVYYDIPSLLKSLAKELPDWKIYFPLLSKWDKPINNLGDFSGEFPENIIIDKDPSFQSSLEILKKSKYGIFTCNGPSHIAYHLGIPRLILDPQFGKLPWIARWKEDYQECIPLSTSIKEVLTIVVNNVLVPQTQMFDRKFISFLEKNSSHPKELDWSNILYFKH